MLTTHDTGNQSATWPTDFSLQIVNVYICVTQIQLTVYKETLLNQATDTTCRRTCRQAAHVQDITTAEHIHLVINGRDISSDRPCMKGENVLT